MYLAKIILFLFASVLNVSAQDERVFRELLTHKKIVQGKKIPVKFKTRSSRYHFDLDGDHRQESFYTAKLDGQDWIMFFDRKGNEIFRHKFDTVGPWSRIYKIEKRSLSTQTDILIVHFFEGITRYLEFEGTSRIYFITIDQKNLKEMKIYKGPAVWYEHRNRQDNYAKRKYEISLFDFDNDHKREVAVRFNKITRVFKYLGNGRWSRPQSTDVAKYD